MLRRLKRWKRRRAEKRDDASPHAHPVALFSRLIPGADDGKVPVARTRVEGMSDFIQLPFTHTFIQQRRRTLQQVEHFLRHGHFDHAAEAEEVETAAGGEAG